VGLGVGSAVGSGVGGEVGWSREGGAGCQRWENMATGAQDMRKRLSSTSKRAHARSDSLVKHLPQESLARWG